MTPGDDRSSDPSDPRGRRRFLRRSAGWAAAAGGLGWAGRLEALAAAAAAPGLRTSGEARAGDRRTATAAPGDDPLWRLVRSEFLIPDDRIFLNVGTLGAQPRAVVEAVIETTRRVAMSLPPGVDWPRLKGAAAALLNCDPDSLAFPRNTTEAMSFIANGLDLAPGDEVLTSDHEHIGGVSCWELLEARRGVPLRRLSLPAQPADAGEILDTVRRAIGPRTRVVSLSHVTFTNGLVLPAEEIVRLCRERGIISVIDGAHPPGMMPVDLRAMAPDFYASSPHKWLLAPQGTGLLYLGEAWRERLWPTVASGGWDDVALGAHRFNHLGTLDESRLAGLDAALRFHAAIGHDRVHARITELRQAWVDALSAEPRVRLRSPRAAELGAGLVAFTVDGLDGAEAQRRLAQENVRVRLISEGGRGWVRISPHVYSSFEEIERVLALLR
jgi:isopenicillin-N epimerase